VILRVRPLHFEFRAIDPVWFPPGKAANIFRGAFGEIFRKIACVPGCSGAKLCPRAQGCAYARMFEPRATGGGPSGFEDLPRPFVLRAASLDGRRFGAGERFSLGVNVFDPHIPALDYFRMAFEKLIEQGLGPDRPRIEVIEAIELPCVAADLSGRREPVGKIKVTFLTPTELKSDGEILREPRFEALFGRARDRVTGLIAFYQSPGEPNDLDFRAIGERSTAVRMTACRIATHDYERRSSRTGQRHNLGGFTGEAEYEGDLAEFLPYLEAAYWTGVGRLTVWGNGMIRAE
jgi:hypothetical protein